MSKPKARACKVLRASARGLRCTACREFLRCGALRYFGASAPAAPRDLTALDPCIPAQEFVVLAVDTDSADFAAEATDYVNKKLLYAKEDFVAILAAGAGASQAAP